MKLKSWMKRKEKRWEGLAEAPLDSFEEISFMNLCNCTRMTQYIYNIYHPYIYI